jgi:fumarate hydratase class II
MSATRVEHDSLGPVNVPAAKFWGAQTQRSLEHFSIGDDLIPREVIPAYAIVKKAAALVNHQAGRLGDTQKNLIVRVCDEILEGQHQDQFPLHVWMTGSGTQFNMNVNEVIANRCSQIAGQPLGRSLMLVTALSPVIGYDKASKVAHYPVDHDLTLKEAALKLGAVSAAEFDRIVDPRKMTKPYVAAS